MPHPPGRTVGCLAARVVSVPQAIDEEMTEVPKRKFVLMGFLDMLSCVLLTVAAGEVRAPLTVLLLQAQLPLQTLLSWAMLRVRYQRSHAIGALLILLGVLVNMGPAFEAMGSGHWESTMSGTQTPDAPNTRNPWFTLAYLFAAVPGALSAAYKESCLRKTPIDMCYLNAWVLLFQFVLGLFAAPIVLKDSLGMGQDVAGVGSCLSGHDVEPCKAAAPWLVGAFLLSTLALHRALGFLLLRNSAAV